MWRVSCSNAVDVEKIDYDYEHDYEHEHEKAVHRQSGVYPPQHSI